MDSFQQISTDMSGVSVAATALLVGIIGIGILISLLVLLFIGFAK